MYFNLDLQSISDFVSASCKLLRRVDLNKNSKAYVQSAICKRDQGTAMKQSLHKRSIHFRIDSEWMEIEAITQ